MQPSPAAYPRETENVVLVGVTHRSAPVEIRERLYLAERERASLLRRLTGSGREPSAPILREAVIVATCNRLEICGVAADPASASRGVTRVLSQTCGIPERDIRGHLVVHEGQAAVEHVMRVATGLDSMVLGEPQILGQVKAAIADAAAVGATGPTLHRLFSLAIRAGKRARAETEIARHSTSIGQVAAILADRHLPELESARALVLGAGAIATQAARALALRGTGEIVVASRTQSKATALAAEIGAQARPWSDIHDALRTADVVVTAVSSPDPIVAPADLDRSGPDAEQRSVVVIDLALPRNVAIAVGDLPGVSRFDLDDLRNVVDEHVALRQSSVPAVEAIIAGEARGFWEWLQIRAIVPAIVEMRNEVQAMAGAELQRTLRQLDTLDPRERSAITTLVHRILGKILYRPTARLRAHAVTGDHPEGAQAIRELFAPQSSTTAGPGSTVGHRAAPVPSRRRDDAGPAIGGNGEAIASAAASATEPHAARTLGPEQSDGPRFLRACRGLPVDTTPIWLMRQAGRYLPEYRRLRERHGLAELFKAPELACEITLWPIQAFELDAAIIFADILPPLEAMGLELAYTDGKGPEIANPIRTDRDVARLSLPTAEEAIPFTLEAIGLVRPELDRRAVPLIGFAGAPFTLAAYAIEGGASRHYLEVKGLMMREPAAWDRLMIKFADLVGACLLAQARAGAHALQLFDSWVGQLAPDTYREHVLPYTKRALDIAAQAGVPIIHFATGTSGMLDLMRHAGGDVISVDWRVDLDAAWRELGDGVAIQGNLDPAALLGPPDELRRQAARVLDRVAGRPGHIFNLGHGVLPNTPPDNVAALVDFVHAHSGARA